MLLRLLELGADPCARYRPFLYFVKGRHSESSLRMCRDKLKRVPYALAKDKEARNVFRKFRGQHPDRYYTPFFHSHLFVFLACTMLDYFWYLAPILLLTFSFNIVSLYSTLIVAEAFFCITKIHRPNTVAMKTPNPKCRLYWCLIKFIDRRYSLSCWYFRPLL